MELLLPIGQPTPLSNIGLIACLRGPDLTSAEARVKAMLASTAHSGLNAAQMPADRSVTPLIAGTSMR